MKPRLTRIALATGLTAIGVLFSTGAPASANVATIGSALTQTSDSNPCLAPCIAVQQSQVGGSSPYPLTSPANGIVTQWAIRSTDDVIFALRILRPAGPNTFTGAGTAIAPTADPNSDDSILRYPASLPIKQGDAIGVYATGGDSDSGVPQHDTTGIASNVWATNALGEPADGATAAFIPEQQHELLLQATVQFCSVPSLKGMKIGAAKQALVAADCAAKVKKKEARKRKNRAKVLKQKTPPGTTAAPGTTVTILVGKKPK